METKHLTLNLLNFAHRNVELSCYLTTIQTPTACRLSKKDVSFFVRRLELPEETEFLYTSFETATEGAYLVTLPIHSPSNDGLEKTVKSYWSYSFLKRYYTHCISKYFQQLAMPVHINFVGDLDVWVPDHSPYPNCNGYRLFQLRVQFSSITGKPELLVSSNGLHSVHNESLASALLQDVSAINFKWVLYENQLFRYDDMSDEARRNDDRVFPCINNDLLKVLKLKKPAPDKSNRYIRFWKEIESFKTKFLISEAFRSILLLDSHEWALVPSLRLEHSIGTQSSLLFGNGNVHTDPHSGMKNYGPKELTPDRKIVFFYICRNSDKKMALTVNDFLSGYNSGFSGLRKYAKIPFAVEKGFSIYFDNQENPLPEIIEQLNSRTYDKNLRYVAIYLSPYSKYAESESHKAIYYRVKEELLHKGIVSQVIEVEKTWGTKRTVAENKALLVEGFRYSLPNIAIALLAKLGGTPWSLKNNDINELVIGISAFKCQSLDRKYLGSAFSFSNEGKFYGFDCFRSDQTDQLAGSILLAVRRYCADNKGIDRLIIHFYKNLSKRELAPIEHSLAELGLTIPVIVVSMNKTMSEDVIGFDNASHHKMPFSGTYLPIGKNQYLLYNSGLVEGVTYKDRDGYPFPLKLSMQSYPANSKISRSVAEAKVPELLQQICLFSQLYWKSVSKQSLPVTLKYPEMLAQIVPHFEHPELPKLGTETLWFL